MQVKDVDASGSPRTRSRADAVNAALRDAHNQIKALNQPFEVVSYRFGATSENRTGVEDRPWRIKADSDATDLGGVLTHVSSDGGTVENPLGGVILISDGTNNVESQTDCGQAARALADAEVPIYAVGVGSQEPRGETRNLVGVDLRIAPQAAVGARLTIEADFECLGFGGQDITVECLWDGTRVGQQRLRAGTSRQIIHAAFETEARPAGFHAVEVRASPDDAAWQGDPATLSQFVRVIDDLIQILYAEAKPRVESGFIVRALAGEQRFRLTRAALARPLEGAWSNPLPRRTDDWQAYHAIILGDLQRRDLTRNQIATLRDLVTEHGTGLALVGGFDNTGSRGLLETDLADALPIVSGPEEPLEGPLRIQPTINGKTHPLVLLGGTEPEVWSRLAAMPGGNRFGRAKPAAAVLLTDERERPLLVAATIGRGRSVAFAIDSTWRWAMQSDEGAAFQRRFWRQLVYWLANRRPRVQITVDRPRYDLVDVRAGTRGVLVDAFVVDGLSGLPIEDARLEVTLLDRAGRQTPITLDRLEDRWTGRLFVDEAGQFETRLVARQGNQEIGRSEARFVVERFDRERRNPLANLDLMKSLAKTTADAGGRYLELPELSSLLEKLDDGGIRRTRMESERFDLADELRWPVLAAICGLLALEWMIRKRAGLV
jgi:uncharacterized membrane protein